MTELTDRPEPSRGVALTGGELARKMVHIGVGLIAFSLRFLGPLWGALLALTAVLSNAFVLPRVGGRRLYRSAEHAVGRSLGIVLYPTAVLILILVFWRRLEVAAATWGILAFGDGMAAVVGMTLGRHKLPWNPDKSWIGTLAYFVFGGAGAAILLLWTVPGRYDIAFAVAVGGGAALFAALLESLPQGLDDNIGVPLVTGLLMLGLLLTEGHWEVVTTPAFLERLAWGAGVNAALALAAWAGKSVGGSGVVVGWLLGTTLYAFLDWRGFLLLVTFFVVGTAVTKLGYQKKVASRLAQEEGGRRGARHAVANTGVAVVCGVLAATTDHELFFTVALAAALATAAADTAGSEIGQLLGRRAFLPTTFRRVPPGTEGAISLEGTAAGLLAAIVVAAVGAAVGLVPPAGALLVVGAAMAGSLLESLAGATFDRHALLDNEAMNFLNTLVGALLGGLLSPLVI